MDKQMDAEKLLDMLLDSEELRDIPKEYIFRVAYEALVLMKDKECFYRVDFE